MFTCENCSQSFTFNHNLRRHYKFNCYSVKSDTTLLCEFCGKKINIRYFKKHINKEHDGGYISVNPDIAMLEEQEKGEGSTSAKTNKRMKILDAYKYCTTCKKNILKSKFNAHVRTNAHKLKICVECENGVYIIQSAFKDRIISYKVINQSSIDIIPFLNEIKTKVIKLIEIQREKQSALKVNFELFGHYVKPEKDDIIEIKSFNTKNVIVTETTNISNLWEAITSILEMKATEFEECNSGWTLKRILHIEININKYSPIAGSTFIALPNDVDKKKACLNIQNEDNKCFMWCILAHLHEVSHNSYRVSHYRKYENELNFKDFQFPMSLKDIPKFEKLNNLSINVFALEFNQSNRNHIIVGPLHHTEKRRDTHINLLYLTEYDKQHYVLIKNMSRLIRNQVKVNHNKIWLCDGCLIYFSTKQKLIQHQKYDCNHIVTLLPNLGENILEFNHYERKLNTPFVIYADFEAMLKPLHTCTPNLEQSFTLNTHKHEPYSFAYYIKCSFDPTLCEFKTYTGIDASKKFVEYLIADVTNIYNNHIKEIIPMSSLTEEQQQNYDLAEICHICELNLDINTKVRDHCHLSGEFRGAAHSACNLNFKVPKFIPIFLHNLSNYDSHLFVQNLAFDNNRIDIIPVNKEKYISFSKNVIVDNINNKNVFIQLRFLDSFRFMVKSLDSLAKNLKPEQFTEISKYFPNPAKFNLVTKKGIFPYEYVDSFEKLAETKLPDKSMFYNSLNNTHVSDEDYTFALKIWDVFQCVTMQDYSNIYLKVDVLLLADIFENFRKICIKIYNLDPCNYFTSPGLSWDAMLKYTKIKLELLIDIEMVHFIKNSIRGGISQCSNRYSHANNKYLPADLYKPDHKNKFIVYWDANNLYGYGMSMYLPTDNFKWLTEQEIQNLNILNISEHSNIGYILEVDITYPIEIHDSHNDFPFCCENTIPPNSKFRNKKLILNLNDKSRYVIHYRNLQQCLENGLQVTKIYRVLCFNQSNWLQKYISLNTDLRAKASNDFEKDFYKLMVNSCYGKTMENIDKRLDIKLLTHWQNIGKKRGVESYISNPHFHSLKIFNENFVAIQMNKSKVLYNKPLYLGFTVLELSKYHMYNFHYKFMRKKYDNHLKLLYSDTDSFIYEIETHDIYDDMKENIFFFDTSNFKHNNQYNIPLKNKAIVGKFKDEMQGEIVLEFIGLRSKMYSLKTVEDYIKRIKGIKRHIVETEISHENYKDALFKDETLNVQQNVFRSNKHTIYTQTQNKLALSPFDDKRYLISGSTDTLAHGHYKIK